MNQSVINSLPQSNSNTTGEYSILARLDGKKGWRFLVQPTEITFEQSANYATSNNVSALSSVQFAGLDGWRLNISNLPLSTLWQQKRLTQYVDELARLMTIEEGKFSPPVLALKWGQRVWQPCVMTNFNKVEKFWFKDGELAECSVSFGLLQVPTNLLIQ